MYRIAHASRFYPRIKRGYVIIDCSTHMLITDKVYTTMRKTCAAVIMLQKKEQKELESTEESFVKRA